MQALPTTPTVIGSGTKIENPIASKKANAESDLIPLKSFKGRSRVRGANIKFAAAKQTTPSLPYITARMWRRLHSRAVKTDKLRRKPAIAVKRLLAKRQLASHIKFSPLRLAFIVSEATCKKSARHPRLRRNHLETA